MLKFLTTGLKRLSHQYFLPKYFFEFCFKFFSVLAGGHCPPDPQFWAGGAKPPQTPPLNDRSSHLIEAAKRGRLDQMIFFSAPLTTRAPLGRVRTGLTSGRTPEHFCDAIFFKNFLRLSPDPRRFLTKIRTVHVKSLLFPPAHRNQTLMPGINAKEVNCR